MTDTIDKTTLLSVFFEWEIIRSGIFNYVNYMGACSAFESVYSLHMTGFILSY